MRVVSLRCNSRSWGFPQPIMPLDPNVALEPNLDGNVGDHSKSYVRLLGTLVSRKCHMTRHCICSKLDSVIHRKSEHATYHCTEKDLKIPIRDQIIWNHLQLESLIPSATWIC